MNLGDDFDPHGEAIPLNMARIPSLAGRGAIGVQPKDCHNFTSLPTAHPVDLAVHLQRTHPRGSQPYTPS